MKGNRDKEAVAAVLLAGGSGTRLHEVTPDKTLLRIGSVGTVISWNLMTFLQAGVFEELVVVCRDQNQREAIGEELDRCPKGSNCRIRWAWGGPRRQDSVLNGLSALSGDTSVVFIHDSARPFVTVGDLRRLLERYRDDGAVALARPVTDTIKQADRAGSTCQLHLEDMVRDRLYAMETPQVFPYLRILSAYREVLRSDCTVTDCTAAWALEGGKVTLLVAEQANFKITNPLDVEWANFLICSGRLRPPEGSAPVPLGP